MSDITACYYTANAIPESFAETTRSTLLKALDGIPLITVSKKPIDFGQNIVVDTVRSHASIYRDALTAVRAAQTKYVALCEDDVLYSPEHFKRRSSTGKFAYNLGAWSVFTWGDNPMFTHKGIVRKNLNSLICERDLFIEAMEERFAKFPSDGQIDVNTWAEPGKYERHIGVTVRETEEFYTNPPNIVFTHQSELSFRRMGTQKRLGEFRAYEIPYWGTAKQIREMYR